MRVDLRQSARVVLACVLVALFAVPQSLLAQATAHVVSPADLQNEMLASSQARQQHLQQLSQFLSSDIAKKTLRSAHLSGAKVQKAVANLSDAELANLASRAEKAQADFAAGTLSDRDLIIIILGIVALVLIIVAVR